MGGIVFWWYIEYCDFVVIVEEDFIEGIWVVLFVVIVILVVVFFVGW